MHRVSKIDNNSLGQDIKIDARLRSSFKSGSNISDQTAQALEPAHNVSDNDVRADTSHTGGRNESKDADQDDTDSTFIDDKTLKRNLNFRLFAEVAEFCQEQLNDVFQ